MNYVQDYQCWSLNSVLASHLARGFPNPQGWTAALQNFPVAPTFQFQFLTELPPHRSGLNPSCNPKSQTSPLPCGIRNSPSFPLMTTSPFYGQVMLSPQQIPEFCKIISATNSWPVKNSKEQNQDDFAISEPEKPCWPLQITNNWKNDKYRPAQSNIQFSFLLIATL